VVGDYPELFEGMSFSFKVENGLIIEHTSIVFGVEAYTRIPDYPFEVVYTFTYGGQKVNLPSIYDIV